MEGIFLEDNKNNQSSDEQKNLRKTPEFKEILRNKFIETAKKYMGIPYRKKLNSINYLKIN